MVKVTTTLVSMMDENMIRRNCEAVIHPLSVKETEAKEYMRKNYFENITMQHWEGVEVKEYWKTLTTGQ